MERKWVLVVAIVVLSSIIATAVLYDSKTEPLKEANQRDAEINETVFSELPTVPENFVLIKRDFYSSQINDLSRINESYWKQPEWYPTWERNGRGWFTEHDYSRWGVHGYGFFPSEISYSVSNMSAKDGMEIYSFFRASWGIETWQGLKITPKYNTTYFDVQAFPIEILLEPTFPKFYYNWTQRLTLKITAKQKVPAGVYTFSVDIGSPSGKKNEEWVWEVLDKYTNNLYHSEIQECKKQAQVSEKCSNLLELRQQKYIPGGSFAPSNQFTATVIIAD